MAELDFSHNVSEIPAGQPVPKPLERREQVQSYGTPDIQNAVTQNAQATNFMSSIGSFVASKASNEVATRLGSELGKNPKGNIGIPLTEFDASLQKSYLTQSEATLGLQADKLITDSNIAASKAGRITPELINKTQVSISEGLKKIYSLAPSELQPSLQKTYGSSQLNQLEHLTNRMLSEQHEDRRNNTLLSNNKNAELAHSLAASGNFKAADELIKSTSAINNSAVAANIGHTPLAGKVAVDTVRQAAIAGRLQFQYQQAVKEKEGEFLKSLTTKPSWISDADYPGAIQSISAFDNAQKSLRSDYEQLTTSQFKERIDSNVGKITGTDLQAALDKLSPLKASELNDYYIKANNKYTKENADKNTLIQNWEDPTAHANADPKVVKDTFNGKVAYVVKNSPGTSQEEAENQVAASAGAAIPVFTKTLHNGLWSGNPSYMVARAKQIDDLQESGSGHALNGLTDMDLAVASDIKHNYNPADPKSAAQIIINNKQNQDFTFRKESESTFSNIIYDNTRKNNKNTDDYILEKFGMAGGLFHASFDSPWSKSNYATDILSNYRTNFINTGRDDDRAAELTQNYIKNNYGKTSINGGSQWTLHPVEKACGFPEGEGKSVINKDIMRQLEKPLAKNKELSPNEYWTIEPILKTSSGHPTLSAASSIASKLATPFASTIGQPQNLESISNLVSGKKQENEIERLQFIKHTRSGVSMNTETYPLRLVGNNFNWDLNLETSNGPLSLMLLGPAIGVHKYTPDVKWIKEQKNG